jgi:DNA polymerase III epsilon subunit-like protein
LVTLMKHLGYDVSKAHRALADCYLTYQLYKKLNEI